MRLVQFSQKVVRELRTANAIWLWTKNLNEKREYENLEKEHLMMQALEDIDKMPVDELQSCISQEQVVEKVC